jgi:hypothetical protein
MDMHGCPLICKMKIHIRTMDMDGNTWASMDIHGDSLISVHIPMVGGSQEGGPRNRGRSHKIGHQKARPLTWKYKNLKFLLCVRSAVHYAWLLKFE